MKFAKKITQIILLVFIFDINIKMQLVNQIGANIELSQFDDSNILIDGYLDETVCEKAVKIIKKANKAYEKASIIENR